METINQSFENEDIPIKFSSPSADKHNEPPLFPEPKSNKLTSHQRSRSVFDKFKDGFTEFLNIQGPKYATQNIKTKSRNPSNVADVFDPNTYKQIETEQATEGNEDITYSATDRPISTDSGFKEFRFKKVRTNDLQPQPELTEEVQPRLPLERVIGSPTSAQMSEDNPLMPAFTISPARTALSRSPTSTPLTRKSTTVSRIVISALDWRNVKSTLNAVTFQRGANEAVIKKSNRIMQGSTVDSTETKKKQYYLHPRGKFKTAWDALISLTLVYYAFMVPIRWSQRIHARGWIVADTVLDVFIWLDIILLFFTATIGTNTAIRNNKEIAKRYIMTFFVVDFVAALPLYRISHDLYLFKILRLAQLYRINRLMFDSFLGTRISYRFMSLIRAFFLFLAALNLIISIWIFPGEPSKNGEDWISAIKFKSDDSAKDISELWLTGAFFMVTTITSVGFGDILPKNSKEMMLVMVFQFLGIIITAVIQSQIYYTMKTSTDKQMRAKEVKLEGWFLKQEHARKKFSDQSKSSYVQDSTLVFQAISQYFRFENTYDRTGLTSRNQFFTMLSPEDQNELSSLIFSSVSEQFSVFFGFFHDENFKREIFINLKPKLFSAEEVILKRGQEAKGLYFILKGTIILSYKDFSLFKLRGGSFFGESALVERRAALQHRVSDQGLECLYISQKNFLSISKRYDDVFPILQKIAFERTDHYKECIIKLRNRVSRQMAQRTLDASKSHPQNFTKNINETIMQSKVELDVQDIDPSQKYIIVSEKELHNQATEVQENKLNFESCNVPFQSFVKPNTVPESRAISLYGTMTIPQAEFTGNLKKITEENQVFITEPTLLINSSYLLRMPLKKDEPSDMPSQIPSLDEADFSDPDSESKSEPEAATISNIIENLPTKEDDSSDEDEGTDSENNSDLNNSLEIPIEDMSPDFDDLNQCDQMTKYIKEKIAANNFRISRLLLSHRDKVLHDWRDMKGVLKNLSVIKEG